MQKLPAILLFPLIIAASAASAADLNPGLWEITMVTRAPQQAGWTPEPFSLSQCVTAQDARDPSRLIGAYANPGATGCSYTEKSYTGSTFRFAMQCGGTFSIDSRGSVTFSPDSFNGTIAVKANLAGQPTEVQNQISGKRLGGC